MSSSMLPPDPIGPKRFFKVLYEGVGANWIEIRPLLDGDDPRRNTPPGQDLERGARRWFRWPDELSQCTDYCLGLSGKFHVYFGVALRKNDTGGAKRDVGCVTAAFIDVDWKDVTPEQTREVLRTVLPPTIVVRSGKGVHVYWKLHEPIFESKFHQLEELNRRILARFKAQRGVQDVSRILRVPGTINIKSKYQTERPKCEVSYFHPENTYTFEDLTDSFPPNDSLVRSKPEPPPDRNDDNPELSPTPTTRELSSELTKKCGSLLSDIWEEGHRHSLTLSVAGALAFAGYSQESAVRVIRAVCAFTDDPELLDRERAVADTYQKHRAGSSISGWPTIIEEIEGFFPENVQQKAKRIVEILRRSLPKEERGKSNKKKVKPDFDVIRVIKFDSRPPCYNLFIQKHSSDEELQIVASDSTSVFSIRRFRELFFEQTQNKVIAPIDQGTWESLLSKAPREIQSAPPEASSESVIAMEIESFLEEAKTDLDTKDFKAFAGYSEEKGYFFTLKAFKDHLRDQIGLPPRQGDHIIIRVLKNAGWESSPQRFGEIVRRVWTRKDHPNGHPSPEPTAPMDPENLFRIEGQDETEP